jgi:pyruvate,water dikinase
MTKHEEIQTTESLIWLEELRREDVAKVGGKNSSLGEMISTLGAKGIKVPGGFATTSDAYRAFVEANGLRAVIREKMEALDEHRITLQEAGSSIRKAFEAGHWPEEIAEDIKAAYAEMSTRAGQENLSVAVRSSATAEDLPDASFAGQQETFLNVVGPKALLASCRRCYASLFTDRAITYRNLNGFDHEEVALSIGVQQMVRSDLSSSGVMFSIDTETGFDKFVLITGAWGLGENVVQGAVDPDEFQVFKPFLDNPELSPIVARDLGAKEIKMIYGAPGEAMTRNVSTSKGSAGCSRFPTQRSWTSPVWPRPSRNITACRWTWNGPRTGSPVSSSSCRPAPKRCSRARAPMCCRIIRETRRARGSGRSSRGGGRCDGPRLPDPFGRRYRQVRRRLRPRDLHHRPDWVPIMKRASAIVTDHGGRTSHAAIVSRELGPSRNRRHRHGDP